MEVLILSLFQILKYSNWNDCSINLISTVSTQSSFFEDDLNKIFKDDSDGDYGPSQQCFSAFNIQLSWTQTLPLPSSSKQELSANQGQPMILLPNTDQMENLNSSCDGTI